MAYAQHRICTGKWNAQSSLRTVNLGQSTRISVIQLKK